MDLDFIDSKSIFINVRLDLRISIKLGNERLNYWLIFFNDSLIFIYISLLRDVRYPRIPMYFEM